MRIGKVELKGRVMLAPMAGVTDIPMRLLCAEFGSAMQCMEMVSAKAILYNNRNTKEMLNTHPDEGVSSLQLFGSDPDILGEIACRLNSLPFSVLDFNMGCPVPKVVNNGEGSALMLNPKLAGKIMEALVKKSDKPVTIKIRKGFDNEHINAVEIAKIAETAGVSAITVHGRTREQYYSGQADWNIISAVKEAVSIPVIGNGDVVDGVTARAMLDSTGCDGIAIGRAARGNPFIFREINHYLATGQELPRPNRQELYDAIVRHASLQLEYKGTYTGVREMRKHVSWYSTGIPRSARLRGRINEMENMDDILQIVREMLKP